MLDPDTNGGYSYNKFKYTGAALTEDDRITYLRNWKEEEEEDPFRAEPRAEEKEGNSGASTPPLWSPPRNRTRTMSPNSKAQAIARGQRELMDMVSRMPEGCYELSLKDIVEHRPVQVVVDARQETTSNSKVVPRRDQKKKKAVVARSRSGSFDNGGGLFLKMLFPVSFGSTKKGRLRSNSKGSGGGGGGGVDGRVSPRPLLLGEGEGSSRYKDADGGRWRKGVDELVEEEDEEGAGKESLGFSSSGKSGSSKSTGSSSRSSSRNSTRHSSFTCWSCIFSNKGKRATA